MGWQWRRPVRGGASRRGSVAIAVVVLVVVVRTSSEARHRVAAAHAAAEGRPTAATQPHSRPLAAALSARSGGGNRGCPRLHGDEPLALRSKGCMSVKYH